MFAMPSTRPEKEETTKRKKYWSTKDVREKLGQLASEFMCEDGVFYKRNDVKISEIHKWVEDNLK